MLNLAFIGSAFIAGMSTFLMPCILPLIPSYVTYLTGESITDKDEVKRNSKKLIRNSFAFIFGFLTVFVLLGAVATSIGRLLVTYQELLRQAGGLLVAIMGLHHMELLEFKFLQKEFRFLRNSRSPGFLNSLIVGVGFAFGWTPCMGPVLTSLLIIASQSNTVWVGILLLSVFGIGLGIPFLVLAMSYDAVWKHLKILNKHSKTIKKISGAILVLIGVLIYFNRMMLIGV